MTQSPPTMTSPWSSGRLVTAVRLRTTSLREAGRPWPDAGARSPAGERPPAAGDWPVVPAGERPAPAEIVAAAPATAAGRSAEAPRRSTLERRAVGLAVPPVVSAAESRAEPDCRSAAAPPESPEPASEDPPSREPSLDSVAQDDFETAEPDGTSEPLLRCSKSRWASLADSRRASSAAAASVAG